MGSIIAGIVVTIILVVLTYILLKRRQNERPDVESYSAVTIDSLLRIVKNEMAEITREGDIRATDDITYEATMRNKRRLELALTESTYGISSARDTVIATIKDIIQRELPTVDDVLDVIDFESLYTLDPMVKWELLCIKLKPEHGINIVNYLQEKYDISRQREVHPELHHRLTREFDWKMLDEICQEEIIDAAEANGIEAVTYDEMTDVLAIEIFKRYHGFGCVDTLMTLRVDGINIGTSGSIRYEIDGNWGAPYKMTNSVWVMVGAYWTLFSFLDFQKVGEMRRVVNQLVSWGASAPMSEKNPYKVVDGYDGSRRTAIRPPAGESWACFIRKFSLNVRSVKWLLDKPMITNWELPYELIYFLMKAEQTTAFTGQQGTGKTTLMAAAMEYIEDKNIRVLEMSFELALRELYPEKNVLTVKPTEYVSSANLQDLLKKTDGWVSSVGEVAEDIVAARMIQFGLIGSAFTLFSHHGKDDFGLVDGLTNSLVASGEYKDHKVANSTVLDVIRHNVHLTKYEGQRPVEYISQIVKENTLQPYPRIQTLLERAQRALGNGDHEELAKTFMAYTMLTREYYTRTTDRISFTSRKIVTFNKDTWTYEPGDWYTEEVEYDIYSHLNEEDRERFKTFKKKWWNM